MINYIYDGSLKGLMTSIYEAYYRHEKPDNILPNYDYQEDLLHKSVIITTDEEKAYKVFNSIKEKISEETLENVMYLYLSELHGIGTLIYNYLRLGWKIGNTINSHLSNDTVLRVNNIVRKVLCEKHLLLGLIRFKNLKGNILYAPIEPDYNIVSLLAPHFKERLPNENWIIHDVKRNTAALYNKDKWIVTEFIIDKNADMEEDEKQFQRLWKNYFDSIAITERINPKLQKRNMPVRYWRYLIEKKAIK